MFSWSDLYLFHSTVVHRSPNTATIFKILIDWFFNWPSTWIFSILSLILILRSSYTFRSYWFFTYLLCYDNTYHADFRWFVSTILFIENPFVILTFHLMNYFYRPIKKIQPETRKIFLKVTLQFRQLSWNPRSLTFLECNLRPINGVRT